MKLKTVSLTVLALALVASPVLAQEQDQMQAPEQAQAAVENAQPEGRVLNLYPKGRASHQTRMNVRKEELQARSRERLENLYTYQAEGGVSYMGGGSQAAPMIPEEKLDAVLDSASTDTQSGTAPAEAPPLPSDAQ